MSTADPHGTGASLQGQVVIVTGGASGIGEGVARRLDALGASVVITSATSVDTGTSVARSLTDAIYVRADVSKPSDVEATISAALERWGRIDGLVNNAGVTSTVALADFMALEPSDWRRVFDVNVFGTFEMTRAALPSLRVDRGWVVNVGSIAGERPLGSSLPYAVSKAAVAHLTTLLAKLVGPQVRVNAVAPGFIETGWTASWDAQRAGVEIVAPLQRTGTPSEVADAVLALATSTYVTGQTLIVDGGLTLAV